METFYTTIVSVLSFFKLENLHGTRNDGLLADISGTLRRHSGEKVHLTIMKTFKKTSTRFLQYFLQGILVVGPVVITGWLIFRVFTWLDDLIPVYLNLSSDPNNPFYLPGIGFIIVIAGLIAVGYFSSFFVVERMLSFFDHLLEKTPGVKIIYTFVKDFSEAFAGKKRKFKKAVLVSIYQPDVWQLGFVTNEDLIQFDLVDHITVYIPNSYAVAGNLFFVKRERVRFLNHVSPTDAMKFAISGGVAEVEGDEHLHLSE